MHDPQPSFAESEPVALTEGIRVVIIATIALLTAFNAWNPTPEQIGAVLGFYIAISAVLSVIARMKSTPNVSVGLTTDDVKLLDQAGFGPKR